MQSLTSRSHSQSSFQTKGPRLERTRALKKEILFLQGIANIKEVAYRLITLKEVYLVIVTTLDLFYIY